MTLNLSELTAVVADLSSLHGERLAGVWQPERDRVILGLGTSYLLLVPRGPLARLHTVTRRPPNPRQPFSFQGACRAHLGGRLLEITLAPGERVVDFRFAHGRLHLRLTGRSGGLWLLEQDRVLAAFDGPAPHTLPPLPPVGAPRGSPRFQPEPEGSWDLAARRHYTALERDLRHHQRRGALERRARRELQRLRRLTEALEGDLRKADEAPRIRRMADALAASLHSLAPGTANVQLQDLEDPEQHHHVVLDPSIPPARTLDKLYRRARRLDRTADRVLEQLDRVAKRTDKVASLLEALPEGDEAHLRELETLLPPRQQARRHDDPLSPWHTWVGPAGEQVLVGRNEKGNRKLTFQRARKQDIWMHLRGRPGAHILIPTRPGQSVPLERLLAAAQIALIHARVPEGTSADVQYTPSKNVRAIPGEQGKVVVRHERVLRVTREQGTLAGWRKTP